MKGIDYVTVTFDLTSDYACEIYTSCKQESFIAQAGISSSIAFLDFLGVNGQDTSLTIITFDLTDDKEYPDTLDGTAYDCGMQVPEDNIVGDYPDIVECACTYCQASCAKPVVDDHIGLIDGLSWKKVGYSYGFFIVFTILFQIVAHCFCNKKGSGLQEPFEEEGRRYKLNNTEQTQS